MYSPREKLRIFNEIPNPGAAVADLNLLQRVAPQHPKLSVFKLNPQRYVGDILFSLLDFSTREEIILNRRDAEKDDKVSITEDAGVFAGGVGDLSDAPVADAPVADAPVADAPVADAPAKKKTQRANSTGKSKNTKSIQK